MLTTIHCMLLQSAMRYISTIPRKDDDISLMISERMTPKIAKALTIKSTQKPRNLITVIRVSEVLIQVLCQIIEEII